MSGEVHPNLFLAGAPKCGTTSLAGWLADHPDVFLPQEKEPSHFYDPNQKRPISYETYLNLFRNGREKRYVLDASIWYMFSGSAVSKINALYPESRFIICLRNPVDMFFSLHNQKIFSGQELIKDPAEAWTASFRRQEGERLGIRALCEVDLPHMAYNLSCSLGGQFSRMLEVIPRSRIHVVLFDDIKARPHRVFEDVCHWLEIEVPKHIDLAWKNRAKRARFESLNAMMLYGSKLKRKLTGSAGSGLLSGLQRLNSIERPRVHADERLRSDLKSYFAPDVALLEQCLGRSLPEWKV